MNRALSYCALGMVMFATAASAQSSRRKELRIEDKFSLDSTVFTMDLVGHRPLHAGQSFTARIHVTPGAGWHIFSSKMAADGGVVPLTIMVPPTLSADLRVARFAETGSLVTRYDSNFHDTVRAYYAPFDLLVKMKVLRNTHGSLPFQLLVHYMTCDSQWCLPPRWFQVPMTILGQKPLKLRISENVEQKSGSYPYELYRKLA